MFFKRFLVLTLGGFLGGCAPLDEPDDTSATAQAARVTSSLRQIICTSGQCYVTQGTTSTRFVCPAPGDVSCTKSRTASSPNTAPSRTCASKSDCATVNVINSDRTGYRVYAVNVHELASVEDWNTDHCEQTLTTSSPTYLADNSTAPSALVPTYDCCNGVCVTFH